MRHALLCLACACAGCGFQAVGEDLGGDDLAGSDLSGADLSGADFTGVDLSLPNGCRPLVVPCLDATLANVIEVPTESTAQAAFVAAKSGDTIQIRGLQLGAGFKVPAGVVLRGCAGAQIVSTISFAGTLGTIEGFTVPGGIIANQTGTFTIRYNRFIGPAPVSEPAVSARSIDGIVGVTVNVTIDSNSFEKRALGIEVLTNYDTMTRQVNANIRNNLFWGVDGPIHANEGGLVGRITLTVEHDSFADFQTAITMLSLTNTARIAWNVISNGNQGIDGDSPYELDQTYLNALVIGFTPQPVTGAAQYGDPKYPDRANGDLRLGPASSLIDAIPTTTTVATDYFGCPRPVGRPDPGAIETQ